MINFDNYESLQLSVDPFNSDMLPFLPEHITFTSLQALILGNLDPLVLNVVAKWELPSLRELSVSRWNPLINTVALPPDPALIRQTRFNRCMRRSLTSSCFLQHYPGPSSSPQEFYSLFCDNRMHATTHAPINKAIPLSCNCPWHEPFFCDGARS